MLASQPSPLRFAAMYHVLYSDKDLLLGNEVAQLLVEYAALMGKVKTADEVKVQAISGGDGDEVQALFVLNGGAALLAETTHSSLPEPDNANAIEYMHTQIRKYTEFTPADFENDH